MSGENLFIYISTIGNDIIFLTQHNVNFDKKYYTTFYNRLLDSNIIKSYNQKIIIMSIDIDKLHIITLTHSNNLINSSYFKKQYIFDKVFQNTLDIKEKKIFIIVFNGSSIKIQKAICDGLQEYKDIKLGEEYNIILYDDYINGWYNYNI